MNAEIVEKLKKILTLANNAGATAGEAEAAMARAKEIAIRHNIDLANVDLTQDETAASSIEVGSTKLGLKTRYEQPYHRWVFGVIRQVFGVHAVLHGYWNHNAQHVISQVTLIGEQVDVAIATAMFPYLEKIFPAIFGRQKAEGKLYECAAHRNGCYKGIYLGILAANKREEEKLNKDDANKYALVVVKKDDIIRASMKDMFPKMKDRAGRSISANNYAAALGYEEGSKVNLRQVGGSQSSSTLKG